jgi:hypothetical protein
MALTPMAEARISRECEVDADRIIAALKEMDAADGLGAIVEVEHYDRAKILRAIRRTRGLDTDTNSETSKQWQ